MLTPPSADYYDKQATVDDKGPLTEDQIIAILLGPGLVMWRVAWAPLSRRGHT